jgi:CheY-like chemotaxis protein
MEAKPLAGRHILLVEDEMMILLMMEEMLIDLGGAAVTSAATVGMPSLRSMDTLSMPPCWT